MRAVLAVLVLFSLLLPLAACGGSTTPEPPAVNVTQGPILHFDTHDVYVITLTPSGRPNGVIALKSVRQGHVTTLDSIRFRGMDAAGSIGLDVSRRRLSVSWDISAGQAASAHAVTAPLVGSPSGLTVWAGGNYGPPDRSERIIWLQDRYVGDPPLGDGGAAGEFAALVRESRQRPDKFSFCLTLKVEGGG